MSSKNDDDDSREGGAFLCFLSRWRFFPSHPFVCLPVLSFEWPDKRNNILLIAQQQRIFLLLEWTDERATKEDIERNPMNHSNNWFLPPQGGSIHSFFLSFAPLSTWHGWRFILNISTFFLFSFTKYKKTFLKNTLQWPPRETWGTAGNPRIIITIFTVLFGYLSR